MRRRVPAGHCSGAATGASALIGCRAGGCQLLHSGPHLLSRSALAEVSVEEFAGATGKGNNRRTDVVGIFPYRPARRRMMWESWPCGITWKDTSGSAHHPRHQGVRALVLGITSTPVFSQWEHIFANPMVTAAASDWVVYHFVVLEFHVLGYRTGVGRQRQQDRQK